MTTIALYIMSAFFIYAGISHFTKKHFFVKAMPPYIPYHEAMVALSGIAEILLGIGLLFEVTKNYAAWGIILLLIAVFPANIYMATSGIFKKIPQILLWLRLPLQIILIWWAYLYTK
ncbi:DoxX family protein [Emticicia sp. SJ17W-69]|uniref:DoxX family protein n=1 Tax=Emticicia sp. SJ17W-69 TaxID=3421657 RepID=UPI003EBB11D3